MADKCWDCNHEDDECTCHICRPDCACGMHPNFDSPEPAEFVARDHGFPELEQYALGWTHGWDDHESSVDEDDDALWSFSAARDGARRGLFNGFALASMIWAAVALCIMACPAQAPPPIQAGAGAFNYGYVTDSARTYLEQGWDTSNPYQVERGYCVEPSDVVVDTSADHANVAWRIHHVTLPTRVVLATPYAISFHCSETAIASVHVHTPSTCVHDHTDPYGFKASACVLGGEDGYLCSVDETDRTTARHDWFMVVQCGRGQFIWYWPGKRG